MDGGKTSKEGKEGKAGILKSDRLRWQQSGSASSDNRDAQELLAQSWERDPVSPQPSVDRLSVTWAEPELSVSSASTKINLYHMGGDPSLVKEARLPAAPATTGEGSEDEDYSTSMSAFICRRESTRRSRKGRGRRPSSPCPPDMEPFAAHRRCSMITTSSAEVKQKRLANSTAASMEEGQPQMAVQEQLIENIRLHKEFIAEVKQERLTMRKKLKLVHQAKAYIKCHEGQLQERLAQSKSTRDIVAKCNILLTSKWQHLKREAANLSNIMIPWELRIKEIESHFGSVVASYFTFLRWLFWVNLVISVLLVVFVIVPEMLTADVWKAGERKVIYEENKNSSTNLLTLWEFEGVLKCSPIFYGYYTNIDDGDYRLPLAYFMTGLAVYVYSFVATLRKMAENSRMSKLSEKEDECIFSWKLFTGWDFMIGNAETAHNRTASIILSFKEALLEEEEKKKGPRNWRILTVRLFVNVCVLILLALSAYAVVKVVERSNENVNHWWRQNEITIVMSLISNIFPIIFDFLGMLEHYHPRRQLRIQLGRIMLLNLLNIYSLIFALFRKIDGMSYELEMLKQEEVFTYNTNDSYYLNSFEISGSYIFLYENETHSCYGLDCKRCDGSVMKTPTEQIITNLRTTEPSMTNPSSTGLLPAATKAYSKEYVRPYYKKSNLKEMPETSTYIENGQFHESPLKSNAYLDIQNFTATTNDPILVEQNVKESTISQETSTHFVKTNSLLSVSVKSEELKKHLDYISSLVANSTESESDESLDGNEDYNYYNTIDAIEIGSLSTKEPTLNFSNFNNDQNFTFSTEISGNQDDNIGLNESKVEINFGVFETTVIGEIQDSNVSTQSKAEVEVTIQDEVTTGDYNSTFSNFDKEGSTKNSIYSNHSKTNIDGVEHEINVTENSTDNHTELISIEINPTENFKENNKSKGYTTDPFVLTTILPYLTTSFNKINDDKELSNITTVHTKNNTYVVVNTVTDESTIGGKISPCYKLKCVDTEDFITVKNQNHIRYNLSMKTKKKLLTLCWETMFGQELVKLTMMDLVICILGTLFVDFFRAVFVRYMNRCWCWNLEKKIPQYGDFKIAENILHLVNNQGMVWMGLFFSPGLAVLNLVKLVIMMYLRSWAVMTCNVPHEVVFRASRSNNFYLGLLLIMLFLCVLPVGYAIVWVTPSWHCGPFSGYKRIYHIFTSNLYNILPQQGRKISDYIASPGIVIPLLVLLILVIYYLTSLTNSLREANNDLKIQLRRERTEERRKMFQLADRRRRVGSAEMENTAFAKWKKILPILPPGKSFDSDERRESSLDPKEPMKKKGDIFFKMVNMALRRPVVEEHAMETKTLEIPTADDESDTEFHELLPEDILKSRNIQPMTKVEATKKRPNVEFVTTKDGKIKEEIVSPTVRYKKKVSSEKNTNSRYQQTSDKNTEMPKVNVELERRAKTKIKTNIRAIVTAHSKKLIEEDLSKDPKTAIKGNKEGIKIQKKIKIKQPSETSIQSRQSDSIGSVIPVITISKTESDDDMLRDVESPQSGVKKKETDEDILGTSSQCSQNKDTDDQAGPSKLFKRRASNLKALMRQSSVDSINEQKASQEKKGDDGYKFQYSL